MGRIQSDVGLISGFPVGDTVNKLMALESRPRDMLVDRNKSLRSEHTSITELAALLVATQYVVKNLGKTDIYTQRGATSSKPTALAATVSGSPALGSYTFVPLRVSQSHQLLSSGLSSDTSPLAAGSVSFRFGDDLERSAGLELLGDGQGFARGKIRITDRSGASAIVDLTTTQSLDDVLETITGNSAISVAAVVEGDSLRLIDRSGQTVSNLKVQEIGGGRTAASLGLAGIDVASDTVDGQDTLRLGNGMALAALNDGRGIRPSIAMPDIQYTLRDGTTGTIDLSPIQPGTSQIDKETTLGQALERINAAAPGKLQVSIDADGKRLVATDLTAGGGTFSLGSLYDSEALVDLGLDGQAVGSAITGRRILGGAKSVLLSSLAGGQGIGEFGTLAITDRSGASASVDLSQAETVAEVVDAINAAGIGITARTNRARTGIELIDTTGASASPMIVASADGHQTAEKLNLAVNGAVTLKGSGDLHFQVVGQNTRLTDLNGGAGVARGTLTIQDTAGKRAVLNLGETGIETVGDVIRAIHRLDLGVRAEINDTGDGIRIVDTAGGSVALAVSEGSSTSAKDLHLLAGAKSIDLGGQPTQVIDGSTTFTVALDGTKSLADLRQKVNDLGAGVTAAVLNDGSSAPYRLSVASNRPGRLGRIVFDGSGVNLDLQETARARDALLLYGSSDPATGILASSPSNTFQNVVAGLTLQVKQATGEPLTVDVGAVDTNLVASVKTMVDNYNKFRKRLGELTKYDADSNTASTLTGDPAVLRMDVDLGYVLSSRFNAGGKLRSLGEIGITVNSDGTLALDEAKLRDANAADPDAVKQFLSQENTGVSARLSAAIEQIAGARVSLVTGRLKAIDDKMIANQDRIDSMTKRLDNRRQQLLAQFYSMETAIAKLKDTVNVLSAIQYIPLVSSKGRT